MDEFEKIELFTEEYKKLCKEYNMMFYILFGPVPYNEVYFKLNDEMMKYYKEHFPEEFKWMN